MARIDITFNTTPRQDAKLARVLSAVNAARGAAGEQAFPTIDAYLRWVVIEAVKDWVKREETVDGEQISAAYSSADDTVQAAVRAALGLP